jgi:hypothetical protein
MAPLGVRAVMPVPWVWIVPSKGPIASLPLSRGVRACTLWRPAAPLMLLIRTLLQPVLQRCLRPNVLCLISGLWTLSPVAWPSLQMLSWRLPVWSMPIVAGAIVHALEMVVGAVKRACNRVNPVLNFPVLREVSACGICAAPEGLKGLPVSRMWNVVRASFVI